MSKQSEAKKRQNYNPKPDIPSCANCKNFTSDLVGTKGWDKQMYYQEKNLRCGIGNFAVRKRGTCIKHAFAVNQSTGPNTSN